MDFFLIEASEGGGGANKASWRAGEGQLKLRWETIKAQGPLGCKKKDFWEGLKKTSRLIGMTRKSSPKLKGQ